MSSVSLFNCHSGAHEVRTMVRNRAPENLEIPGLVLAHHPGMTNGYITASSRHHFIAENEKLRQRHAAETRGERDVGGVAAGAHQDAADARMVVAGVAR